MKMSESSDSCVPIVFFESQTDQQLHAIGVLLIEMFVFMGQMSPLLIIRTTYFLPGCPRMTR